MLTPDDLVTLGTKGVDSLNGRVYCKGMKNTEVSTVKTEVWFYTNKQGHKLASRWSRQQFRSFPIGYDEAKRRIAAGEAVEIPGHPFPNHKRSAYSF